MSHVITGNCVNCGTCTEVCPVDSIHPSPDEADFNRADMLYIDPRACLDCGACAPACPVDAIMRENRLPLKLQRYREINARFSRERCA